MIFMLVRSTIFSFFLFSVYFSSFFSLFILFFWGGGLGGGQGGGGSFFLGDQCKIQAFAIWFLQCGGSLVTLKRKSSLFHKIDAC